MEQINWPQIIVGLIGGGAVGAIITATVSSIRSRRQPVGSAIGILPVFRPRGSSGQLEAAIIVTQGTQTSTFKNLFLVEVQLINRGNRDLDEFKFGVTLDDGDRCIYVETTHPDRYHVVEQLTPVTPTEPRGAIDFSLRPFNRRDLYSFRLYVVVPDGRLGPDTPRLETASPIRFVAMSGPNSVVAAVAQQLVVSIAGVSISAAPRR